MTDQKNTHQPSDSPSGKHLESKPVSRIQLDPDKYRSQISDFGYTVEEENELLGIIWNIMCAAVDLGWGLDSTQVVLSSIMGKSIADSKSIEHIEGFNQVANAQQKGDCHDE